MSIIFKFTLGIGILCLILVVLYFTGRKSVHHEITINASPKKVWLVLTNTKNYDSWNPVMKLLEGEIVEGNDVKYLFTQDENNASKISSTVQKVIPNQLLNQSGGVPIILTFNHKYILKPENNQTRVTIHEDYVGIGVNFWNPKAVEQAYVRLNKALK